MSSFLKQLFCRWLVRIFFIQDLCAKLNKENTRADPIECFGYMHVTTYTVAALDKGTINANKKAFTAI